MHCLFSQVKLNYTLFDVCPFSQGGVNYALLHVFVLSIHEKGEKNSIFPVTITEWR